MMLWLTAATNMIATIAKPRNAPGPSSPSRRASWYSEIYERSVRRSCGCRNASRSCRHLSTAATRYGPPYAAANATSNEELWGTKDKCQSGNDCHEQEQ